MSRWDTGVGRDPEARQMALDPKFEAALALHRFGFGPRGDAIVRITADPRGALLAEVERPSAGRIDNPDLLTGGEAARAAFDFRQEKKGARLAEAADREAAKNRTAQPAPKPDAMADPSMQTGEMKPGMQVPPPKAA